MANNYAGVIVNEELPNVLQNPEAFADTTFATTNGGKVGLEVDLLDEDQRARLADEYLETQSAELAARKATAGATTAEMGLRQQAATIERAGSMPEEIAAATTVAEGEATISQVQSEAANKARFTSDVSSAENSVQSMFQKFAKPTTLKSGLMAAGTAAFTFAKQAPGPLFDLIGGVVDKESYDIAEQKGQRFVSELTGQPEDSFLSRMGGGAGVVGEMFTGAVADPEGAARTNLQMLSLMGMTPTLDITGSIPDAAPPQTGTLEAEDAASNVQDVENRARRGQTTSMLDVQPQTL